MTPATNSSCKLLSNSIAQPLLLFLDDGLDLHLLAIYIHESWHAFTLAPTSML